MKRLIGVVLAASLILSWGARPASAHTDGELRWEGAAIALGTIGAIVVLNDVLDTRHHDGCGERWAPRGHRHEGWRERDDCGRGGHRGWERGHSGKHRGWREGYCR